MPMLSRCSTELPNLATASKDGIFTFPHCPTVNCTPADLSHGGFLNWRRIRGRLSRLVRFNPWPSYRVSVEVDPSLLAAAKKTEYPSWYDYLAVPWSPLTNSASPLQH